MMETAGILRDKTMDDKLIFLLALKLRKKDNLSNFITFILDFYSVNLRVFYSFRNVVINTKNIKRD